ncbi:hypothetical protein [Rhizobium changzhiense]|uniref:hypothetical protein n=1 Tax=Rhizobium changzhiense TaxID=2692317 RepID=UPI001FEF53DC|nr:hypothetical protein [Rhizobium changzhiense]
MSEADKKRILDRLDNMRGEILAKIRPREQRYETEKPPEHPYVFSSSVWKSRERSFRGSRNFSNGFGS